LSLRPDYAEAHEALGVIYYASGKRDAALEEYKKLQSLNSPLAGALFRFIYGDRILEARR
jgi:tetratricopeptide (TPR) repeat protein